MEKVAEEKTTSQISNFNENTNKKVVVLNNGKFELVDAVELNHYKAINSEDWWLAKDNATIHKYNIAIQCIARQEEKYFKEWIEHHLRIGIEHIFIYDNNDSSDKGKLKEFLQSVLTKEDFSKIEVIPWHEPMLFQQFEALKDCVEKHKDDIKWLLSIDLDEFFVIEKPMAKFLEEFSYASQVYFSWESIGADGQLHYEDKPVAERFKKAFSCKDGAQGKVMFRPERLNQFRIHGVDLFQGKTVNVLHKEVKVPDSFANIHKIAWVKHYFTKSLEEWLEKMNRGCADHLWGRKYSQFFNINFDLVEHFDPKAVGIQEHGNAPSEEVYQQNDMTSDIQKTRTDTNLIYNKSELKGRWFEISAVEHCNLNCAGCSHFSPVATKEFICLERLDKDLKAFHKLVGDNIDGLKILGGEPLLHPQIAEVIYTCKKYFPSKHLMLYTNGLLLESMSAQFFKACKECGVKIIITKYPSNSKLCVEWLSRLSDMGIDNCLSNDKEREFHKIPLDSTGSQNVNWNWYEKCFLGGQCNLIRNGKIFPCTTIGKVEHLNRCFGTNYEVSSKDYFDLHNPKLTYEDFKEFITNAIPFCKYCNFNNFCKSIKWRPSKKEIGEWE